VGRRRGKERGRGLLIKMHVSDVTNAYAARARGGAARAGVWNPGGYRGRYEENKRTGNIHISEIYI
jgi:hypothetical protein